MKNMTSEQIEEARKEMEHARVLMNSSSVKGCVRFVATLVYFSLREELGELRQQGKDK